jgi:hypothetical protein
LRAHGKLRIMRPHLRMTLLVRADAGIRAQSTSRRAVLRPAMLREGRSLGD